MSIIPFTALRTLLQEEGLKSVRDFLFIANENISSIRNKTNTLVLFEDKLKWIGLQKHHTENELARLHFEGTFFPFRFGHLSKQVVLGRAQKSSSSGLLFCQMFGLGLYRACSNVKCSGFSGSVLPTNLL